MKKILISIILTFCLFSKVNADWDSTTNMQTLTVSAAFEQVQTALETLDATIAGTPPTNIKAKNLVLAGATSGTTTITPAAVAGTTTVTLPAANSVTLPSGAVFFMITGSCPAGTTDVSATYANKFIKVNATQGTSSGVVLTGTSDSHTLTTAEMPAHTHTIGGYDSASASSSNAVPAIGNNISTITTSSAGSGGGHTHTLSTATTLEPSSITMKLCQCD